MSKKIRVGIIGVGNCFAGLIQGIEYYKKHRNKNPVGLMHVKIGPYSFDDIEFVSAFDVGANKIGQPLDKAVFASPNLVRWTKLPKSNVIVKESPILDGIGIYVENRIKPLKNPSPKEKLEKEIIEEIKKTKTEILVNYLPVGSQKATEFWAGIALKTGCAFVNCLPAFIASNKNWAAKFKRKRI
ncbi:MAG: myo-inositol-1-phosphate synthase, partial [Candidatus Nealsonbacteria bacterium CG23_combo_of_CG06-09_8_20_14_all_37_18]